MVKDSFCLFQSNLSSHCPFVLASLAAQSLRDWAGLDWTGLSWTGLGWAGRERDLDSSSGRRTSWKKETPKRPQACLQRPPHPLTPLPWARVFIRMMTQLLQYHNIWTLAGMMTMKAWRFFICFFVVFFIKISPLTWTTSLFRRSTTAPSSITSPLHVSRNLLLLLLRWSIGGERRPSCGSRERHSLSVFPVGNSRRFPASHWIGPLSVRGLTPSTVRLLWLSVCWIAVILAARISSNRGRKRDPHHDEEWGFAAL